MKKKSNWNGVNLGHYYFVFDRISTSFFYEISLIVWLLQINRSCTSVDTSFSHSMDNLDAFLTKLKAGELEAFVKSEAVPETQGELALYLESWF